MHRHAKPSDLPGIIALWSEAFGDSPQAVRLFFDSFPRCRSFVTEQDGQIVSMVHALPRTLSPDCPAAYVYAVATRLSHRGRGLCRQLMAFAEQSLGQEGFSCCVLTPGEQSLFDFYTRLGYRTAFTRRRTAFPGGTPICLQDYLARREDLLTCRHMVCDEELLSYAAGVYGLGFYETASGIAAAGEGYTAECLPEDLQGQRRPFAMIKWLTAPQPAEDAYLGFALE